MKNSLKKWQVVRGVASGTWGGRFESKGPWRVQDGRGKKGNVWREEAAR